MKGFLKKIGMAMLMLLTLTGSFFCFQFGFSQLSDVRQLDRLPLSTISVLANGTYVVSGHIEQKASTITAPYSKDQVIYYEYRLEEEYRDSDGKHQVRTIDSGSSATAFALRDHSGRVAVNPGFQVSEIHWRADRTYRQQSGRRIYSEWTLRAGDQIELLAWYDPNSEQLELAQMPSGLKTIVTAGNLNTEGGQGLFVASLLVSTAAGLLAIGLALALVLLGVHRYWFFVVLMTFGLLLCFWGIGFYHLKQDWQTAAELYQQRAQAVFSQSDLARQQDLYAMYVLIENSARQWPDSRLFTLLGRAQFPQPTLDNATKARIQARLQDEGVSQFQHRIVALAIFSFGVLATIILIVLALRQIRFKRLVEFIPTSQSTGLSYGLAELFGMIEVDETLPYLSSKLNRKKCIAYQYEIEEKRGRGKNSRWVSVESGEEKGSFWLEDQAGRVAIDSAESDIRFPEKYVEHRNGKRYTEYWLPPYRNIYCLGFAGISAEQSGRLSLQSSSDFKMLITTQEEDEVVKGKGSSGFLLTGAALGFSLMAGTVLLAMNGSLTPLDLIRTSLIVPLLLVLITAILHYNGLVFLRNRVSKTRADIDTLLQRRHDLWPQLFNIVQGHLQHEKKLMQAIGRLRSGQALSSKDPDKVTKQVGYEHKVMDAVMARAEDYPQLRGNEVMQKLIRQLQQSEDELALIRQGYNDSVELYNTQIEKLPDVILAKLFGFRTAGLFQ